MEIQVDCFENARKFHLAAVWIGRHCMGQHGAVRPWMEKTMDGTNYFLMVFGGFNSPALLSKDHVWRVHFTNT